MSVRLSRKPRGREKVTWDIASHVTVIDHKYPIHPSIHSLTYRLTEFHHFFHFARPLSSLLLRNFIANDLDEVVYDYIYRRLEPINLIDRVQLLDRPKEPLVICRVPCTEDRFDRSRLGRDIVRLVEVALNDTITLGWAQIRPFITDFLPLDSRNGCWN